MCLRRSTNTEILLNGKTKDVPGRDYGDGEFVRFFGEASERADRDCKH